MNETERNDDQSTISDNAHQAAKEYSEIKRGCFRITATDVLMTLFTGLLVVITGLQWCSFLDSNKVAKVALDAAKSQQRAYVFAIEGRVTGIDSGRAHVQLTVKNTGQTPSHDTIIEATAYYGPYPPKKGALMLKPEIPTSLGAGESADVDFPSIEITQRQMVELAKKRMAIYAIGVIKYMDIFNEQQETTINLIQGGDYDFHAKKMGVAERVRE